LAWTAIVLIVMVGMVGLCFDWGKVTWNVEQIQNAADAAALAGAQIVKLDMPGAITRTHDFALKNEADRLPLTLRTTVQSEPFSGNEGPLDIILGRWVNYDRTFVATLDAPSAVKVIARRTAGLGSTAPPLGLVFGPMFGKANVEATRTGIAWCPDSSASGVICLSGTERPGLYVWGNGTLEVDGGGIHVNSSANPAVQVGGSANLDTGFVNAVGTTQPAADSTSWTRYSTGGEFSVTDSTTDPAPTAVPDPVAAALAGSPYVVGNRLNLPALIDHGIPTRTMPPGSNVTLTPGYYPNGINWTGNKSITLQPSSTSGLGTIFVFGGAGLNIGGKVSLTGHGVTCYVTKTFPNGAVGNISLQGSGTIELWSPGDELNRVRGTNDLSLVQGLNGIVLWQDPTTGATAPSIGGTGTLNVHGTLYFPNSNDVSVGGNGGNAGNQIVCGSLNVTGSGTVTVSCDGRNSPTPSRSSYLVK
jgi:hypothetical protein